MAIDFEETLVKLSKAKDGDILVLKCDDAVDSQRLDRQDGLRHPQANQQTYLFDTHGDLTLMSGDEARSILERIVATQKGS